MASVGEGALVLSLLGVDGDATGATQLELLVGTRLRNVESRRVDAMVVLFDQ